jgi:hypothetical protein
MDVRAMVGSSRLRVVLLIGAAGAWACGDGARVDREAARQAEEQRQAEAREEAAVAREAQRLAALWTYHDVAVDGGRQRSATIASRDNVETGGARASAVRLVFRDHPAWGRSAYLLLDAGDFNCGRGCTVAVGVDDAAPRRMAARRPQTDEAIAMFVNDAEALWRLTAGAKALSIEFPVQTGGTRTATFDVAGLDRTQLPSWDTDGTH